ncbi:dTMP kinase [Flaviflexus massiliensis]|uniref:dTMP kinase n=1 Tax=Flaviflexus massiliensis TaxID=1522309 RepID=UPI0006D565DB|nr:dTMP kinase [Flaviflexus massiliensis]
MTGKFISFEGGDGAGKTTQIGKLAERLEAAGTEVVVTREPGGTELGLAIRQALLHGEDLSPRTEALLYAADRAHHIATVVRPALDRGATVITDRYMDSSIAYQGAARGLGMDTIGDLNSWAVDGLMPDLTFLLDLDPVIGATRIGAAKDRLESAGDAFHAQVRRTFLDLAGREPERFVIIDASGSPEQISEEIGMAYGRL